MLLTSTLILEKPISEHGHRDTQPLPKTLGKAPFDSETLGGFAVLPSTGRIALAMALPYPLQYCHLVVKIETCGFAPESPGRYFAPKTTKAISDPENARTIITENSMASKNRDTWGVDCPLSGSCPYNFAGDISSTLSISNTQPIDSVQTWRTNH